ncbi:hypothetical protein [Chryseobacterium wangxinyae]|uniref:hypothetical protein n=1 Tax=Chryseobacterium sp. CY353 TaxID=2997334 RepID=UPI00227020DA|nr:hypothetical protein [Chryseobacterium sp. CY353]MCY0968141.1 hypothetical protein [Chryseobacterium sp. CY353]
MGDGLRNSGDVGNKQFQTLVNSEHPIPVSYDMESTTKDKGGYQLGVTGNAIEGQKINTKTNEVVDVIISESNITINVGVISEFVSDVRSGKQDATEKGEKIIKDNTKLTAFDMAIAVLGHEIDHSQSKNQTDKANGKNPETVPTQKAEQILQDIANKKNNEGH